MTATTPASGSTAAEEPAKGPYIKLRDAPYAPVRWIVDEAFWKNITINLYSAAVVAVVTVTLVSIAQMVKDQQYVHVMLSAFFGLIAIGAPPGLAVFSYGLHQRKRLPKNERVMTIIVFAANILISLGAISFVIVLGIRNIIGN